MPTNVVLTKSGMGIEEGTVVEWLRSIGDRVTAGEVVVEIETAKAVQEIEAPASGVLSQILVQVGETVSVNADLAIIEDDDG